MMRFVCFVVALLCVAPFVRAEEAVTPKRPNILLAISDDQSFPHASAYGSKMVNTPAFDRVAEMGVLCTASFAASPGCSPCRAALLTGRHCWQIENAGTHASSFPAKYVTYPDLLETAGYFVGYTGKGWSPGNYKVSGRERNPAGPAFSGKKITPPYKGISSADYAANFETFLDQRPDDQPFCFWYGAHEPHRGFEAGAGLKDGKKLDDAEVPSFLPGTKVNVAGTMTLGPNTHDTVRSDVLDYAVEVEWFDKHLGRMLDMLEERGELDNTLIIVTSDNGMAFPRAKANCYEYGIHMPLAICWANAVPGGRTVDDLIGHVDLTATILDAAGVEHPSEEYPLAGRSLMNVLSSDQEGVVDPERTGVYSSRERHSSSRWHSLSYPIRALRTHDYLYIRNFKPERWPAGAPQKCANNNTNDPGPEHGGYHDIDGCPTLSYLIQNRDEEDSHLSIHFDNGMSALFNIPGTSHYYHLAVDKRPAEELFNIKDDPGCLKNLVDDPEYAELKAKLAARMDADLRATGDPRVLGNGDIFETYPRYSSLRRFPQPEWSKGVDTPKVEWVPWADENEE